MFGASMPKVESDPLVESIAKLRQVIGDFNANSIHRNEITESDSQIVAGIVEAVQELPAEFDGYQSAPFREAHASMLELAIEYRRLNKDAQLLSLSSGQQLEVPLVESPIGRKRISTTGSQLLSAVDRYASELIRKSERQADELRGHVAEMKAAFKDPVLSHLLQAYQFLLIEDEATMKKAIGAIRSRESLSGVPSWRSALKSIEDAYARRASVLRLGDKLRFDRFRQTWTAFKEQG